MKINSSNNTNSKITTKNKHFKYQQLLNISLNLSSNQLNYIDNTRESIVYLKISNLMINNNEIKSINILQNAMNTKYIQRQIIIENQNVINKQHNINLCNDNIIPLFELTRQIKCLLYIPYFKKLQDLLIICYCNSLICLTEIKNNSKQQQIIKYSIPFTNFTANNIMFIKPNETFLVHNDSQIIVYNIHIETPVEVIELSYLFRNIDVINESAIAIANWNYLKVININPFRLSQQSSKFNFDFISPCIDYIEQLNSNNNYILIGNGYFATYLIDLNLNKIVRKYVTLEFQNERTSREDFIKFYKYPYFITCIGNTILKLWNIENEHEIGILYDATFLCKTLVFLQEYDKLLLCSRTEGYLLMDLNENSCKSIKINKVYESLIKCNKQHKNTLKIIGVCTRDYNNNNNNTTTTTNINNNLEKNKKDKCFIF